MTPVSLLAVHFFVALPALGFQEIQVKPNPLVAPAPKPSPHRGVNLSEDRRFLFNLQYAQSPDALGTYQFAIGPEKSILDYAGKAFSKLGTPDVAFGSSSIYFKSKAVQLGVEAEVYADAFIQNPVVPEIYFVAAYQLRPIVEVLFPKVLGIESKTKLGVGWGYEYRMDAFSLDFIQNVPLRKGYLRSYSVDQSFEFQLSNFRSRLKISPTYWDSTSGPGSFRTSNQMDFLSVRMRFENFFRRHWWGLHFILGQQPLATQNLPKLFDYAFDLNVIPELGTLVGGGASFFIPFFKSEIEFSAGVYAGLIGAHACFFKNAPVSILLSSYGVETSSAYLVRPVRLTSLSVGFHL